MKSDSILKAFKCFCWTLYKTVTYSYTASSNNKSCTKSHMSLHLIHFFCILKICMKHLTENMKISNSERYGLIIAQNILVSQ